jgi:integrase
VRANLPAYLRDFTLFAWLTEWRPKEIRGLSWRNLDGDTIRLPAENAKTRVERKCSTVRTRRIDGQASPVNVSKDHPRFFTKRTLR